MKRDYREYLEAIGITEKSLLVKAEKAIALASVFAPGPIEKVFVNDFVDQDGKRNYEDLECFGKGFVVTATSFVTDPHITVSSISKCIKGFEIRFVDFDTADPGDKARLQIKVYLMDQMSGVYKASGNNCTHLMYMYKQYLLGELLK